MCQVETVFQLLQFFRIANESQGHQGHTRWLVCLLRVNNPPFMSILLPLHAKLLPVFAESACVHLFEKTSFINQPECH